VTARVDTINRLAREISDLDVQITNAAASGVEPNDARDTRDLKIEELSKLIDISVTEDARGSVMVSVGGTAIASRAGTVPLRAVVSGTGITIESTGSGRTIDIRSGELKGVLDSYNTTIPDYLGKLDDMAAALITRVNSLHSSGYGLGTPPSTGIELFTGSGAADIDINAAIVADVNLFAASGDGTVGNNDIAIALAGVGEELLLNGNAVSLTQFYSGFVSGVGSAVGSARQSSESMNALLGTLEQQRSSVSGVSLDEEMVNMIKFQHAYDAAAKVVTTADELFQTILNMV
jgi:flagellar hook-associated protein 1 FlgK